MSDMKDIDKLERYESEQLIEACKLRIESIDKKKIEEDRLEKKNKPLKTKIKDLEVNDIIYSIDEYPITDKYKEGYRVLKCYVSAISHLVDNETSKPYISISIVHETEPAGRFGMPVYEYNFDCRYLFYSLDSFYTLNPDTWKEDYQEGFNEYIDRKKKLHQDIIKENEGYSKKFLNDNGVVAKLLVEESGK